MIISNISIYKNENGTATISNDEVLDSGYVYFPIELIPSIIECLNRLYLKNNGKSDIREDENE